MEGYQKEGRKEKVVGVKRWKDIGRKEGGSIWLHLIFLEAVRAN